MVFGYSRSVNKAKQSSEKSVLDIFVRWWNLEAFSVYALVSGGGHQAGGQPDLDVSSRKLNNCVSTLIFLF